MLDITLGEVAMVAAMRDRVAEAAVLAARDARAMGYTGGEQAALLLGVAAGAMDAPDAWEHLRSRFKLEKFPTKAFDLELRLTEAGWPPERAYAEFMAEAKRCDIY